MYIIDTSLGMFFTVGEPVSMQSYPLSKPWRAGASAQPCAGSHSSPQRVRQKLGCCGGRAEFLRRPQQSRVMWVVLDDMKVIILNYSVYITFILLMSSTLLSNSDAVIWLIFETYWTSWSPFFCLQSFRALCFALGFGATPSQMLTCGAPIPMSFQ